MRMPVLRRKSAAAKVDGQVGGVVRIDRRTKNLTKRLGPGEIAVIHHADLDRVSAEALVRCAPSAVVNVVASTTGRYPNLGPGILLEAGIPLIDAAGEELLGAVDEGDRLLLDGGRIRNADGEVLAEGTPMTVELLEQQLELARAGLSDQIDAFAANTMEYLRQEKELLLEGVGVPEIVTPVEGRHVLMVVRGYDYRSDLEALRPYISEYRPLLVGVDGGADALLEVGLKPEIILGDMDSCSDAALRSGAELIVHAYRDGRAPGVERLQQLGLEPVVFPSLGTSEDAAMLLLDSKGARLIVAVGTHASLVEFLDKGRAGMASTFLTRLRVGPKLVDAKGVSRIYRSQINAGYLVLLILSAFVALIAALAFTDFGQAVGSLLVARWNDFVYWVRGLFS